MSKRVVQGLIVLICIAFVSTPVLAGRGGKGGGGGSSECASASLALSTYTATAGVTRVGIYGPVSNCASRKGRFQVVDTFTSACGVTTTVTSAQVTLQGNQTKLVSSSYFVPEDTCPGTATVTRTVSAKSRLASDTATLTVQ